MYGGGQYGVPMQSFTAVQPGAYGQRGYNDGIVQQPYFPQQQYAQQPQYAQQYVANPVQQANTELLARNAALQAQVDESRRIAEAAAAQAAQTQAQVDELARQRQRRGSVMEDLKAIQTASRSAVR
jgi:hypothetical protein